VTSVGVIGLGRTGLPVAHNLLARGHDVVGFRRSASPELEGHRAASVREVAERCSLILTCLPSGSALDEVIAELGTATGIGHVVIELGSHPLAAKERARDRLARSGAIFLDGEVSGTPAMTAARTAVILVAGERADCEPLLSILRDATDYAVYAGAFGSATKLKLVANLLVAVHTAAAAEALLLVEKSGIDAELATEVLGLGAASSTMLKARAGSMLARKFVDPAPGPVSMLAAYLAPIRELAGAARAPTPLFSVAAELYEAALADGRANQDIGCVIELIDARKGKRP
jgi:3-hydroxyisobutyrate dehydrogenase